MRKFLLWLLVGILVAGGGWFVYKPWTDCARDRVLLSKYPPVISAVSVISSDGQETPLTAAQPKIAPTPWTKAAAQCYPLQAKSWRVPLLWYLAAVLSVIVGLIWLGWGLRSLGQRRTKKTIIPLLVLLLLPTLTVKARNYSETWQVDNYITVHVTDTSRGIFFPTSTTTWPIDRSGNVAPGYCMGPAGWHVQGDMDTMHFDEHWTVGSPGDLSSWRTIEVPLFYNRSTSSYVTYSNWRNTYTFSNQCDYLSPDASWQQIVTNSHNLLNWVDGNTDNSNTLLMSQAGLYGMIGMTGGIRGSNEYEASGWLHVAQSIPKEWTITGELTY